MSDGTTGGGIRARANSENDTMQVTSPVDSRTTPKKGEGQEILCQGGDDMEDIGQSMDPRPSPRLSSPAPEAARAMARSSSSSSQLSTMQLSQPELRGRSTFGVSKPPEPPVTKATLSELDVSKIIHNPKLRHDINFDPELHFRPNLDGEKGRRKAEKARQFWDSLKAQLMQFVGDREGFYSKYGHKDAWCLPQLLNAVKEIIQTLVPQRDREFLNEGLDVQLFMQQFHKGTADLEKLASWLSGVLKLHCAPMRDDWVNQMHNKLSEGNRENNMDMLVDGLHDLLSVLEAMKLDVANHQIRCLRPVLIEDTVHFEHRFFFKKMQAQRLRRILDAKDWYRAALERGPGAADVQQFGDTAVFFSALSRLVLPSTPAEPIPETFCFDDERIAKLRSDVLDSINLEVCMRLYEDLEKMSRILPAPSVMDDESCSSGFSLTDVNFYAPTSRPSSLALSFCGSEDSSPRNSWCIVSHASADNAESRTKARNLYNSLLALLQTAPSSSVPGKRWSDLQEPIAYQIFRYVNVPQDIFPAFQKRLGQYLSGSADDGHFSRAEEHFHNRFVAELGKRVKEFKNLPGVTLFSLATGRPQGLGGDVDSINNNNNGSSGNGSTRDLREDGGIEDMATRLAHLGILHWRVWAPLLYIGDIQTELSSPR